MTVWILPANTIQTKQLTIWARIEFREALLTFFAPSAFVSHLTFLAFVIRSISLWSDLCGL